ncbi:ABC transporter permease [Dictyobacter arantiisoli]|uniref:Uncharacterized protein n=1 Tax=Dictyobacter arantiisoli TaxID=2014874 RepID=A0A5A5T776_9CHLR|nr:ABC transporter permease [Dictyobacter arantiisoli]GCF07262.1 hypothetical protein KDI_08260 [Dictyobacter arantiisoli]
MNEKFAVFWGACAYEFKMQCKRPTVWVAMLLVELFMIGIMTRVPEFTNVLGHLKQFPILRVVVYWTDLLNYILPVAFGILLADRLQRDKRTRVDELLTATPSSHTARLYGKFLGSSIATALPILLLFLIGIGIIVALTGNIVALPMALATFAAVIIPGLLFVGAFSVSLPAFIWVPLYQIGFVGYWFWGNLYQPKGIPTLSTSILTPAGGYMSLGFFGTSIFPVAKANAIQGIESLLVLVFLSLLVVLIISKLQKWQQAKM